MAEQATEQTQGEIGQELKKVTEKLAEGNVLQQQAVSLAAGEQAPETPHGDVAKHHSFLQKHFGWMKKETQRAGKLAKMGLHKVADFGKAGAKKVEHFAKNILDLLLKGLGLAALWALFKWASEADWEKILKDAKVWWEEAKATWTQLMADLSTLSGVIEKVKGWVESFTEKWETISNIIGGAWIILTRFAAWYWMKNLVKNFKLWFGKNAVIRVILSDIRKVFGKNSTIGGALKALKDWMKLKLFNFSSPFRNLLRWIKSGFGPGSRIGKALKAVKNFGKLILFGIGSPLRLLLAELRVVFGANSAIAKRLAAMRKGAHASLFGPNSIIGRFRWFFTAPIDKELSRKWHTKVVGEAPVTRLWNRIKNFFRPSPYIMGILGDIKGTSSFQLLFGPDSSIMKMVDWVKNMFGMGGKGGFSQAIAQLLENPAIQKLVKGLATIGKRALAILGPVAWVIAAYDAIAGEGGFMDKFQKEKGSLWDKVVAGLSGAIQNLINFFIVDLVGLAADSIQWLMKKVMGIFGYDEKEIEKSDWYKFSVGQYLKDAMAEIGLFLEGYFTLDIKKMWKGASAFFGRFGDLMSWIINKTVIDPLNWLAKELFGEDAWQIGELDITKWFTENVVDPIFAAFKKIWDIDWSAAIIGILPEWAVKIAKETGLIEDRTPEQIAKEEALEAAQDKKDQALWDKRKKESGLFGAILGSTKDLLGVVPKELLKIDKDTKMGGYGSFDPNVPKVIPKLEKDTMGGYGNYATNVQNIDAKQAHQTSVIVASSADNPAKRKHFSPLRK